MEKIRAIYEAAKWYRQKPTEQYTAGQVENYDTFARELTDRVGFGNFLANHIGNNPGSILELAAGTGLVSKALDRIGNNIVYSDIAYPPLTMLRDRVEKPDNIVQSDFLNLPFVSDSFDTIVLVGGYRYVPQEKKDKFWTEVKRVLKKDGRFFVAQFYPRGANLQGKDISQDVFSVNHNFSLVDQKEYDAHIKLGSLSVKSGKYISFEFTLLDK